MEAVATTLNVQFVMSGNQLEMRPLVSTDEASPALSAKRFPTLREVELEYIQKIMTHVGGNRSQAARVLGIDRVSLWRKLKQMDESVRMNQPWCRSCGDNGERPAGK